MGKKEREDLNKAIDLVASALPGAEEVAEPDMETQVRQAAEDLNKGKGEPPKDEPEDDDDEDEGEDEGEPEDAAKGLQLQTHQMGEEQVVDVMPILKSVLDGQSKLLKGIKTLQRENKELREDNDALHKAVSAVLTGEAELLKSLKVQVKAMDRMGMPTSLIPSLLKSSDQVRLNGGQQNQQAEQVLPGGMKPYRFSSEQLLKAAELNLSGAITHEDNYFAKLGCFKPGSPLAKALNLEGGN